MYLLLKIRAARISFPELSEKTFLSNPNDFWMLDNKTGKKIPLKEWPEQYTRETCVWTLDLDQAPHIYFKKSTFYIINYIINLNFIYIHTHTYTVQGLAFPGHGSEFIGGLGQKSTKLNKFPSTFKLNLKMKWKVSIVALNSDLLMLDHISFYRGFTALCIIINHSRFCWAYECNIWITGVLFSVCTLWLRSVLSRILSS